MIAANSQTPDEPFRVFTTFPAAEIELPPLKAFPNLRFAHSGRPGSRARLALLAARVLWRADFDAILVEGGREALFMSFFKLLFRRRVPIVSCLVYLHEPPANAISRMLHALKMAILRKGTDCFVLISTDEIESYHRVLGIPKSKLVFIPYKMNSQGFLSTLEVKEGAHIYAGGDSIRDYETLFEAVRGLDVRVKVLTNLRFPQEIVPENVEIVANSNTPEAYYRPCAESLFAVVPMKKGYIRCSGQATYLGAMFLGKAVVVSDIAGVRDLVEDRKTGLIVPPGDVPALRAAIRELSENRELRETLGRRAREHVKDRYTVDNYLRNLLRIVSERVRG